MSFHSNTLDPSVDIRGATVKNASKTLADEALNQGQAVGGQSGAAASVSAVSSGIATITGLTGMSSTDSRGRFLTISGAATGANNGTFLIVAYISATSVDIANAGAVAGDANNGSISWTEREPYTLDDDVNFARTDRAAIKGVAYDAAIPTYQRPTAVGTNVPANLANIAGKTADAIAWIDSRKFENVTFAQGNTFVTLSSAGNLKHADSVDRTGVPVFDGADAGAHESTYVELIADGSVTSMTVIGKAVGSITVVAGANLVDGETFVLNDGTNPAVTFEFDDDASVVPSATLRAVTFTGAETATQIRDLVIAAINAAPTLDISAVAGGAALVNLTNDVPGTAGNQTITETVVDGGFIVSGMSGGTADGGKRIFGRSRAGASTSPDAVEIELRAVAIGAAISTSVAYTWERDQPTTIDVYYAFRQRADLLDENFARKTLVNGLVGDANLEQDISDILSTIGTVDGSVHLGGLLTNLTNFFPFSELDVTPSVVEALNKLNEEVGNRDYTAPAISAVPGLADGQTITASIEALALAIADAGKTRTIERVTVTVAKNVAHTLPGGLTYVLDGTNNGRGLYVYWRGVLRHPGTLAAFAGNEYLETSTTEITPYVDIKPGEIIDYFAP